jgi:hypothetical protein
VSASNLAYTLRNVDAAAQIGTAVLSVGLHRPLTPAQQAARWFWTEQGESDPVGEDRTWALAVERLRAVGSYAAKAGINISLEMYRTPTSALRTAQLRWSPISTCPTSG